MATLAQLRSRIVREVNREDLLDAPSDSDSTGANTEVLDLCIQRAIEYYATQRFTFNEQRVVLGVNGEYTEVPYSFRLIDLVKMNSPSSQWALRKQDFNLIEEWQEDSSGPDDAPGYLPTSPYDFTQLITED